MCVYIIYSFGFTLLCYFSNLLGHIFGSLAFNLIPGPSERMFLTVRGDYYRYCYYPYESLFHLEPLWRQIAFLLNSLCWQVFAGPPLTKAAAPLGSLPKLPGRPAPTRSGAQPGASAPPQQLSRVVLLSFLNFYLFYYLFGCAGSLVAARELLSCGRQPP